jgi:hypothetical protein
VYGHCHAIRLRSVRRPPRPPRCSIGPAALALPQSGIRLFSAGAGITYRCWVMQGNLEIVHGDRTSGERRRASRDGTGGEPPRMQLLSLVLGTLHRNAGTLAHARASGAFIWSPSAHLRSAFSTTSCDIPGGFAAARTADTAWWNPAELLTRTAEMDGAFRPF